MAQGGGGIAAQRANASGEDRLSALPDDALVHILLHLDTAAAAVRTSVLSRRWRRVWTLLPELRFDFSPEPHPVASALAGHAAALRFLQVGTLDATPESVAAWLPVAASRLSGRLIFDNRALERNGDGEEDGERGAFELPCFTRATDVSLDLGFLGLTVPAAGVFARLTELCLVRVRIHGLCKLGDAVSSPRCPCLQKLTVKYVKGLDNITMRSESLLLLSVKAVFDLQQLTVVAPVLKELTVRHSFLYKQNRKTPPIVDISASQLERLEWMDAYDSSSVHLCKMEHIQRLSTTICPYGPDVLTGNYASFLSHFKALKCLWLTVYYRPEIRGFQYLIEDITVLPQATLLRLIILNQTHAFGDSVFHLLKLCTGVRRLWLELYAPRNFVEQYGCPSGCACDQPENWKTKELTLNSLQEITIFDMKGTDNEVAFVKQLFSWAKVPTEITFSCSISKSKAREVCQTLSTFCKPGTSLKCYMFHNAVERTQYLLAQYQSTIDKS